MSGVDDIRDAIAGATVLAFPRRPSAAARDGESSQMGGKDEPAAAERHDGDRRGGGDDRDTRDRDPNIVFGFRPMTDLGNAERFAGRYKDALRYCPSLGWLAWDGRRWSREGAEEAVKRAEHATARAIQDEAEAIAETDGCDFQVGGTKTKPIFYSDKLHAWGRASEGAQKLAAMSKRAGAMLAIAISSLDADPMRICVLNGTLRIGRDIADGYVALEPHDPNDYITRLAPVTYDPSASCPLYDRFLDEIQPPDVDDHGDPIAPIRKSAQAFLHQWFGYSLTGDTAEQKMVFLYGKGRNGKGVLVNVLSHVAGDYADQIPIESFLDSGRARAGGQATPDIAALPGVRLLGTSEPKKGATLDEAFVKLFTGGDRIKARHLNKDYFAFTPQAKLTMQGNYRPKISGADEGIWGRIILVPCLVFIPPERRDAKLFDKLTAESSGILNRLLDGLRDWLDRGLVLPETVKAATAQYRSDSDPLGRFLEACVEQEEHGRVQATRMHDLFAAWAKANGESVWTIKGLGTALKERGIGSKKSDTQYWIGIRLTKSVFDFGQVSVEERERADRDDGRDDDRGGETDARGSPDFE